MIFSIFHCNVYTTPTPLASVHMLIIYSYLKLVNTHIYKNAHVKGKMKAHHMKMMVENDALTGKVLRLPTN